jgi:NodT family efflux transporter outer membrane factor (OMF) lipoprotein
MVGPDYRAPDPVLPDRWQAAHDPSKALTPVPARTLKTWWTSFNDRGLNRLMERAQRGNLDLKIAYTRIEASRAERRANRADLFPKVSAIALPFYQDNLLPGASSGSNGSGFFLTGFDALWEIDVFGRLRRRLEAATAMTESASEDYRHAWVALSAELAREYTEYRNLQEQLRITAANLAAQRQTLELTRRLFDEGVGARHDVTRASAQTETTAAQIPELESQLTAAQHRLELLIGAQPGALGRELAAPGKAPVPAAPRAILTAPADTLRQRPDIRRAERGLAAATAQQGAALAELFPKISVAAFVGMQNSDLENLFRSSAFSWASGSAIMQPIFNFGRIRAGIDLADARQQEAYLAYQKAVLDALRETETAMTQYLKEEQRRQGLNRSVNDLNESARLSELRYREGVATFLEVLDAQRVLYAEELALAQSEARHTIYLIALYKALGGADSLELKPAADPVRPWG